MDMDAAPWRRAPPCRIAEWQSAGAGPAGCKPANGRLKICATGRTARHGAGVVRLRGATAPASAFVPASCGNWRNRVSRRARASIE